MKFYSSKELAAYLQINPSTICRWKIKGMPFKRIGGFKVEYDLDEIIKWLKSKGGKYWSLAQEIIKRQMPLT